MMSAAALAMAPARPGLGSVATGPGSPSPTPWSNTVLPFLVFPWWGGYHSQSQHLFNPA